MSDIFSGDGERMPVRQVCTLLYATMPPLDAVGLHAALEALVGPCVVEWAKLGPDDNTAVVGGVAQFGLHKVVMIAIAAQVRQEVLAVTVGVSPMPEADRQAMLEHGAAIRLLYVGEADDPVEQLTALYQVAGIFLDGDALGIINERAALALTSNLARAHLPQLGSDIPPISLWTGVVTYSGNNQAGGREGYLLRTYGMDQSNLPELAIFIEDRALADTAYDVLLNVGLYLAQDRHGIQVGIGDRVEFRDHTYLLTDPGYSAQEFASERGLLLLVEV